MYKYLYNLGVTLIVIGLIYPLPLWFVIPYKLLRFFGNADDIFDFNWLPIALVGIGSFLCLLASLITKPKFKFIRKDLTEALGILWVPASLAILIAIAFGLVALFLKGIYFVFTDGIDYIIPVAVGIVLFLLLIVGVVSLVGEILNRRKNDKI